MLTIAVTGASSGIGRAAAVALSRCGHRVVAVGRDPRKLRSSHAAMRSAAPDPAIVPEPVSVDLARLASVSELADRLAAAGVEVLVNNAGIQPYERSETPDGIESTLAVNHLAPLLLTRRLAPILANRGGAIVTTASSTHLEVEPHLHDLQLRQHWTPALAYGRSKLFNVMMTSGLRRTLDVPCTSFHPGDIVTAINRDAPWVWATRPLEYLRYRLPRVGADTLVWLCTVGADRIGDGLYFVDRAPAEHSPYAVDDQLVDRLLEESDALIWSVTR